LRREDQRARARVARRARAPIVTPVIRPADGVDLFVDLLVGDGVLGVVEAVGAELVVLWAGVEVSQRTPSMRWMTPLSSRTSLRMIVAVEAPTVTV